jgi:uncharacterized membrane protein YhaH (DUF805 family)
MELMFQPFRKYADFQGRARRSEYWLWRVFVALAFAGLITINVMIERYVTYNPAGPILIGIFLLAIVIPSVAVTVRRLHDTDKSGWMIFIGFVPFIGALLLLVFYCTGGTRGANRYGLDPKSGGADASPAEVFS